MYKRNRIKVTGCSIGGAHLGTVILMIICWGVNLGKLIQCDFDAPYKGEIVHAIGVVIAPASLITVWFSDEN